MDQPLNPERKDHADVKTKFVPNVFCSRTFFGFSHFLSLFLKYPITTHLLLDHSQHTHPHTMSEPIHTSDSSLDHDIELVEHEDGNSKYSSQTIRQKQGRQVVSSFTATSSSSEDIAAETGANGETTSGKKTTTTTTTTTHSKAPVQTFPSVGFYQGLGRLQAISGLGFAAFAFVHVIPPMLASFGGVELANKALIWGRVYYQVSFFSWQIFVKARSREGGGKAREEISISGCVSLKQKERKIALVFCVPVC